MFGRCLTAILKSDDLPAVLSGNQTLFLLANLIHLSSRNLEVCIYESSQ